MVAFKILTLAFAATATASNFYAPPPVVPSAVSVPGVTIVTSTVTVVGKAPSGPDPTGVPAVVTSAVASSSSEYINLSSELSKGGNNLTSTVTKVPSQASTGLPTGNLTTTINSTLSATATVSATPSQQPTNAAAHGKIGVAVGIVALALGVLGP